jgi:hypothetical protein
MVITEASIFLIVRSRISVSVRISFLEIKIEFVNKKLLLYSEHILTLLKITFYYYTTSS